MENKDAECADSRKSGFQIFLREKELMDLLKLCPYYYEGLDGGVLVFTIH